MTDHLLSAWDWEPSVIVGSAVLALGYLLAMRRRLSGRAFLFLGGVLILLLDLVSPLDLLADTYLFSAHVAQHLFMTLAVPPLLLLGLPDNAPVKRIPVLLCWVLGVGAMVVWHLPSVFNAVQDNEPLHIFQHLSLLATGTLFWFPLLGPPEEERVPIGIAVPYLFSACTICSLLGASITWGTPGIYHAYLHPDDQLGILPLIRNDWGLSIKTDQQLGGLLMWVPGCFVYLTAILASLARWYRRPEPVEA
jgi:cytochrome c oxidase assembly factor CtaG